jgi:putative membrane protein
MRRRELLAAGLLIGAALPLARAGMTGHMAAHMIAVALAAPLLALALRGSAVDPTRLTPVLASALAMSVVELAVVWWWHVPAVRAVVAHDPLLTCIELASFLIAGTLLWSAVLAVKPEARIAGAGALLLTSMHMTLLGALIGLAPRTLYPGAMHLAPGGLTPLQDQQLAGVVMLLVGGVAYLIGALAVLKGVLAHEHAA